MSNYLNDYGLPNEINLTIFSFAYQLIIEDIKNFIYKVDKSNFSKFCSIIFLSYYKEANANFEERIEKEINSINEFIKTNNINNKDTIMSLAKKLQSSNFKDEKVLNEVIDELSSLTGKNIDDSKRDKIIKAIKNDKVPSDIENKW